ECDAIINRVCARMTSLTGKKPFTIGEFNTSDRGVAMNSAVQITEGTTEEKSKHFGVNAVGHLGLRDAIPAAIAHLFKIAAAVENTHKNTVERIVHAGSSGSMCSDCSSTRMSLSSSSRWRNISR